MKPLNIMTVCQSCHTTFRHRASNKRKYCSHLCYTKAITAPLMDNVDRSGDDDSCWPWKGRIEKHGYGRVRRGGRQFLVHRVVYEELVGQIPDGFDLIHSCDNPPCCNPRHLKPATHIDNMTDMVAKGRSQRRNGEQNHAAKLTEDIVRAIISRLGMKRTAASIARELGVGWHSVTDIKLGRRWRHIPRP